MDDSTKMTITYTLPSVATPHGGYRIILEHLSRLQQRGHDVTLFIEGGSSNHDWYGEQFCPITRSPHVLSQSEIVVIGSPHSIWFKPKNWQKVFCFVQMAEHLFRPNDKRWLSQCKKWYESPYPKLYGSHWIAEYLKGDLHYIEDGINTDHFLIEKCEKDYKIVLVEGWECNNAAKDTDGIACRVVERLKQYYDMKVYAYGFLPLKRYAHVPDVYQYRPSLTVMNDMYRQASVLIKATHYDSRSLSPIEAMTKGCVTARAIEKGDDYLINDVNCVRCKYNEDELYNAASYILAVPKRYHLLTPEWPPIIDKLEKILLCQC